MAKERTIPQTVLFSAQEWEAVKWLLEIEHTNFSGFVRTTLLKMAQQESYKYEQAS